MTSEGMPLAQTDREEDVDMAERTIVVGVDGSSASIEALRWAVQQAKLTDAGLEVISAWERPALSAMAPPLGAPPIAGAGFNDGEMERAASDNAQRMLDAAMSQAGVEAAGIRVNAQVTEGHPAPILIEAAEGADLLVVGSRGHGAFMGMLLGSVTNHVTAHAPCPVVVVRDKEEN